MEQAGGVAPADLDAARQVIRAREGASGLFGSNFGNANKRRRTFPKEAESRAGVLITPAPDFHCA